ncbi:MAG: prephenate dehydrogenase/arogenate dehydrogenase family protein, partial [Phycisphaerae bacterium]
MTSPTPASLAELRAKIDAIDADILQALAQRMGVVAEIAQFKRAHRIAIRDRQREAEVFTQRRQRAEQLGLPTDEIDALYHLILLTSRDQQAALRVEIPPDLKPRTVAVIGASGGIGSFMVRLFADLGNSVLAADLDTELTPIQAAQRAEVILISVPIPVTEQVIRQVGPHVSKDALLMDVTSVKQGPVQAMLEATPASVLGTHPMFGPNVHSLQGQRVVLCPGRGDDWADWVRKMFHARGLVITETTPQAHDRAMAVVQ